MAQNLAPATIRRLVRELRSLDESPPDGCKLIQGDNDTLNEVLVEMEGPEGTPFAGGKFNLKMVIGPEYPQAPPKGYFITKIYHPNVGPAGDICVNTLKKDWKETTTMSYILAVIRCLLIEPNPESSLNDEAGKLFMDSFDDYAERARLMTGVHAKPRGAAADDAAAAEEAADPAAGSAEDVAALASSSKSANTAGAEAAATPKAKVVTKATKAAKKQKENKKKAARRL